MTDDTIRGGPGAGDVVHVPTKVPCATCVREGTTANHTHGPRKLLNPGHTHNQAGKPAGRKNDSTIEAQALRREHAKPAMEVLVKQLDDDNPYIRFAAAKALLGPMPDLSQQGPPDTEWMTYATEPELEVISKIVDACRVRMASDPARLVQPDDDATEPTTGDTFTIAALPAPAPQIALPRPPEPEQPPAEQQQEEDDDWVEVGPDDKH